MPEAFVDAWYRNDSESVKEWWSTFIDTTVPDLRPVLLKETLQQARNYDDFWDRTIARQGLIRKAEYEQFDEYTSRAAIALGRIFDKSPKRIDHAIRGIGGSVAADVVEAVGLGPKGAKRESEAADLLIIGRLFKRGGKLGTSPKVFDTMYEALSDAQIRQASDETPETQDERKGRLILSDAARAVSSLMYVRSQTFSSKESRGITGEAMAIAKDALSRVEAGRLGRGALRSARRKAEQRKKKNEKRQP